MGQITLKDVTKKFGDTEVIPPLNLTVNDGEFVVFVGPSGISPWHNEEMRAGLDQAVRTRDDYRVIPVLLPGANEEALTGFLARRTWVDFRPGLDDAEAFERLEIKTEHSGSLTTLSKSRNRKMSFYFHFWKRLSIWPI